MSGPTKKREKQRSAAVVQRAQEIATREAEEIAKAQRAKEVEFWGSEEKVDEIAAARAAEPQPQFSVEKLTKIRNLLYPPEQRERRRREREQIRERLLDEAERQLKAERHATPISDRLTSYAQKDNKT